MIHAVFQTFQGKIQQIPPMYSAVKVQGKPLYQLARKGIEVDRKEREVEVLDIQVQDIVPSPGSLQSLMFKGDLHSCVRKRYWKKARVRCSPASSQTDPKWFFYDQTIHPLGEPEGSFRGRRSFAMADFIGGGVSRSSRDDWRQAFGEDGS